MDTENVLGTKFAPIAAILIFLLSNRTMSNNILTNELENGMNIPSVKTPKAGPEPTERALVAKAKTVLPRDDTPMEQVMMIRPITNTKSRQTASGL